MGHTIKVTSVEKATHDVLKITTEKPGGFTFTPGQATEVAINREKWQNEIRPFTFTNLPDDDHLEFTIKTYPAHNGVTKELLNLKQGDELIIGDAWGTIKYKGEGTFIAGGAGVTPFVAILRQLYAENKIGNNKLIFANRKKADIINRDEFQKMLGKNFINILSDEKTQEFANGFISENFLKEHLENTNGYVYLCGPEVMMDLTENHLDELGIRKELIVKEEF